jgi:toxin CcdB
MARFDVHQFASKAAPLVLDVQADILDDLASRVVVPLVPLSQAASEVLPRLKPVLMINDQACVMMTTDIAALPVSKLGKTVTNIEAEHRDDIIAALDFLFLGF